MEEDAVLRNHADLDPAAGQEVVELPVALPVQQCLHFGGRFVPALLEGGLADVFRNHHVGGIEFAVANDPHLRDHRDLLADQLEDRAAEVAGNAVVRLCPFQLICEEGMVEALAAGGKAADHGLDGGGFRKMWRFDRGRAPVLASSPRK